MKRMLLLSLLLLPSCTTSDTLTGVPAPGASPTADAGAEALVLRLEDRREYDPNLVQDWMKHADPARRERIALALGRIGTATFGDTNGNGVRDADETAAGTAELRLLATDPNPAVRRAAAFAMGESGDPVSVDALFKLAADSDASVAAEAAEALSKLPKAVAVGRFQELTSGDYPAAVREVAVRYLFRFGTDEASSVAAMLLESLDPAIRREAAYTLARRAFPPARRKLESLLAAEDVLTRAHAARALGLIAGADSLRALQVALDDPHAWVRTNAARSVAQILDKHPEILESELAAATARRTIAMTNDPDNGVRVTAVELLGRFARSFPTAGARLREIADGNRSWMREQAALALAASGLVDHGSTLLKDQSPWVRARLAEGSSQLPAGVAIRAALAGDRETVVRAAVLNAIPDVPSESDREIVASGLNDDDVIVRATAIGKLAAEPFRTLAAADWLAAIELVERGSELNDARVAAVEALAASDGDGRESRLVELLRDRDPMIRRVAADGLERLTGARRQYTPLPVDRPLREYEEIASWAFRPHSATIRLARGDIDIELFSRDAPLTTWNFATLAKRGYFDGTTFMRVVPNFVLQGGDPRNDMSGGPGYAIRDEINQRRYSRGAVGMALSGPDTGGSQFFITHSPQPHLDGGYTVFARVVAGLGDVADIVERGDRVDAILVDAKPVARSSDNGSTGGEDDE